MKKWPGEEASWGGCRCIPLASCIQHQFEGTSGQSVGIEILRSSHWSIYWSVAIHPNQTSSDNLLLAIQIFSASDSRKAISNLLVHVYQAFPFSCPFSSFNCGLALIIEFHKSWSVSLQPFLSLTKVSKFADWSSVNDAVGKEAERFERNRLTSKSGWCCTKSPRML